jgi:hypothetical protein
MSLPSWIERVYERKRLVRAVVQWSWLIAVAAFCVTMGDHYWDRLNLTQIRTAPSAIALSFLLIALGKILVGLSSVRVYSLTVGDDRLFAFRAYHISQIGKYIPGSVWQHASRAYLYQRRGIRASAIASALTKETVWLLFSSMALGTILMLLTRPLLLRDSLSSAVLNANLILLAGIVGLFAFGIACISVAVSRLGWISAFVRSIGAVDGILIGLLVVMWSVFGVSLFVLIPGVNWTVEYVLYSIGLFAVAYGLGFVVIFAPAGLGIREAVLGAGLIYFVDIATAIVIIVLHRLLYLIGDVAFFAAAALWQASTAAESDAGG